jgi:acyl carrier protein
VAKSETLETVKRFIAEVCAVDLATVQPAGKLLAYGLDSVRLLDLIMAVEDRYGLEIGESDPDLAGVETVADLAAFIDRQRGGAT